MGRIVISAKALSFEELGTGKTSGSRRKFMNFQKRMIHLHKPHPGNIVKKYIIWYVIEVLNTSN